MQTQGSSYCLHRHISSACNNNLEVFHLTVLHVRNENRSKRLFNTFHVMLCNWFLEVHCSSGCWWVFGFNCGSNRLSPLEAAGNINLSPFSCSRVHTDRQLSPGHDACYCQLCRESALGVLSSVTFSCKPSERFAGITFNFWQLATISKANDCGFGWQKIPLFVVSFLKSLIQRDIYIYIYHSSKWGKFAVSCWLHNCTLCETSQYFVIIGCI